MGITYDEAPREVFTLISKVIGLHHSELKTAEVKVACIFAHGPRDADDNITGPAIKLGGYQCAGCIKKTSLKERAFKNADAQMILDGDRWHDWSDLKQEALIDHELQHLEVVWERYPDPETNQGGLPRYDDLGRPKLAIRLHDIVAGGFIENVKRYGHSSFDTEHVKAILDEHGQHLMPFLVDEHGALPAGDGGMS